MTRISKQTIDKRLADEIWKQLYETFGRLSAQQSAPFISELLGKAEQIMLAKRLAVIVLIHEQHSDYAISKTLKVSSTTVGTLRRRYNNRQYDGVIKGIKKNKTDYTNFIEILIDVIHLGLPRYAGPGRWKLLTK